MERVTNCNLCGSAESSELKPIGKWRLLKCAGCNLVYLNPRPSPNEIDAFYPKDYERHRALEHYLERNNKWVKFLYDGIANANSFSKTNYWRKIIFRFLEIILEAFPLIRKMVEFWTWDAQTVSFYIHNFVKNQL